MKKIINLLLFIFVFSFIVNVKADMGPPSVIKYYVTVVNKDGAICFNDLDNKYTKTDQKLQYGETYYVDEEVRNNKYVYVYNESGISCLVQLSDIMVKNNNFDIKSEGVEKIEESKAVIFAKGGLNLRKGPAMSYAKIVTVPQYTVVTIKYRAGTYWYYAEYNGYSGWISGINYYFGYDSNDILYDIEDTNIYDEKEKVIGTIPKYTEVTDYVELVQYNAYVDYAYYVNYKGIKGYVKNMPKKVDGEIKLLNDTYVYNGSKVIDKIKNGEVVKYTVLKSGKQVSLDDPFTTDFIFYIPSKNGTVKLRNDTKKVEYEVIKEIKEKKLRGYIGEGLFGEEKEIKEEVKEETKTPINEIVNPKKNNSTEIIIICVLSSIIGALTCFIIIKLVNIKKENKGVVDEKK